MQRRRFLTAAGAGAALAFSSRSFAQEMMPREMRERAVSEGGQPVEPHFRYPETTIIRALDPRFNKYMIGNTYVERLWTGALWAEGPIYFGDMRALVFSDIPNNRLMKFDESSGQVSVLRQPSNYANGNTRDREGRLLSCLQDERCVKRTEHDGSLKTIAQEYEGKKLNGPNDIVVKSDDTIWFTDPGYGIGSFYESTHQMGAELPRAVYRYDPAEDRLETVSTDQVRPNGIAFSPDEKKIYICDTGITDGPDKPSNIMVYDVTDDNRLINGKVLFDLKQKQPEIERMVMGGTQGAMAKPGQTEQTTASGTSTPSGQGPEAGFFKYGIADGIRLDTDGNIWAGTGWGGPSIDGVTIIADDGTPIGRIMMPEVVANVDFGGEKRNRLYMAGSTSLYAVYVNIAGARQP
jgi:gluconolactonase